MSTLDEIAKREADIQKRLALLRQANSSDGGDGVPARRVSVPYKPPEKKPYKAPKNRNKRKRPEKAKAHLGAPQGGMQKTTPEKKMATKVISDWSGYSPYEARMAIQTGAPRPLKVVDARVIEKLPRGGGHGA